jgi:hypothetical protein
MHLPAEPDADALDPVRLHECSYRLADHRL